MTKLICLLVADGPYRITDATGKTWTFELPHYGGPVALHSRTEDPLVRQPGEKSKFWDAFEQWEKRGRKTQKGLKGRVFCVWEK